MNNIKRVVITKRSQYNYMGFCIGSWYYAREEYKSGCHSIWYYPSNTPNKCAKLLVKNGIDPNLIEFPDSETRVLFFNNLPLDIEELVNYWKEN